MAQSIMHLLIADAIYKSDVLSINVYGDFLLGSIAPDAVHTRQDYKRELKDLSHYSFNSDSQLNYFDNFLRKYESSENRDFVIGYLTHLVSDMVWYHSVRVPFKERFAYNKSQKMSMNEAYYFDCEQLDYLLSLDDSVQDILQKLNFSIPHTLEGLIEANSIEMWKKHILKKYESKDKTEIYPKYILEKQIRDYITQCTDICINYLRGKD